MALNTRLDARSDTNNRVMVHDKEGYVVAIMYARSPKVELAIEMADGYYLSKPNGFSTQKD